MSTDTGLLRRVSRGDDRAFELIFDRHVDAAWTVALAYADDTAAAERAVQAAFLEVWRRPEPGARTSLAARLLAAVRRQALAHTSVRPHVQPRRRVA